MRTDKLRNTAPHTASTADGTNNNTGNNSKNNKNSSNNTKETADKGNIDFLDSDFSFLHAAFRALFRLLFRMISRSTTLSAHGTIFLNHESPIPDTWILFDNQSTVDVFCNRHLLKNIHETDTKMTISSQGGKSETNQVGLLSGYGWVWFDPNGIANIISMSRAERKGFEVTYKKPQFIVTHPLTGNPAFFHAITQASSLVMLWTHETLVRTPTHLAHLTRLLTSPQRPLQ
jgi:hypothetical protein